MKPIALAAMAAAALPLPYTLNLTGQGPFYAKAGVPSCLAAAQDDLGRQRKIVEHACARDGGTLSSGAMTQTLVQGVLCTAVMPLTCGAPGRVLPPAQPADDGLAFEPDPPKS